jgi:hypothetical protein
MKQTSDGRTLLTGLQRREIDLSAERLCAMQNEVGVTLGPNLHADS